MAISTLDGLIAALGLASAQHCPIDKASMSNATAGVPWSLWRATGTPAQGAIPSVAAVCDKTLTGALRNFTNPVDPAKLYLGWMFAAAGNSLTDLIIADRLCAMGGLNGTLLTQQAVSLTLVGVGSARYATDVSDVQWFLEWYTDTGATASNATVNVTYTDDTSENLAVIAVGGTVRAGRLLPLIPATAGKIIKAVNHVTLSASTGTAGSFGVTAYKVYTSQPLPTANLAVVSDWAALGFPQIPSDACLALLMLPGTTSTGTVRGMAKLATG